jgi:hypothetical protein
MSDTPYKDSIDRLLNGEVAPPHEIARLDRIMQYRTAEAMNGLSNRLTGVMDTSHRAAQLGQEKADDAIRQVSKTGVANGKQQKAMIGLTVALVVCTLAYTGITAWSAYEMRQSNLIQADLAKAAHEQVLAAQEANAIQRQQIKTQNAAPSAPVPDRKDARSSVKR